MTWKRDMRDVTPNFLDNQFTTKICFMSYFFSAYKHCTYDDSQLYKFLLTSCNPLSRIGSPIPTPSKCTSKSLACCVTGLGGSTLNGGDGCNNTEARGTAGYTLKYKNVRKSFSCHCWAIPHRLPIPFVLWHFSSFQWQSPLHQLAPLP